jgi:hypothetical protein
MIVWSPCGGESSLRNVGRAGGSQVGGGNDLQIADIEP